MIQFTVQTRNVRNTLSNKQAQHCFVIPTIGVEVWVTSPHPNYFLKYISTPPRAIKAWESLPPTGSISTMKQTKNEEKNLNCTNPFIPIYEYTT